MERKEKQTPIPVPPIMSDYEWNLRFRRHALLYREFNQDKQPSLLDIVHPLRNNNSQHDALQEKE